MLVIATSVEDDAVPPVKKLVRAKLHLGGWIMRPIPDPSRPGEDKGCQATYIVKSDLMVWRLAKAPRRSTLMS